MDEYKSDKDGHNSNFMTGTQITNDILKQFNYFKSVKKDSCKDLSNQSDLGDNDESVFKNIQRRVYDTINVLDALNVIKKYHFTGAFCALIDNREGDTGYACE